MCSSPCWCGVLVCSLKDCRLVSNPVVLVTSSFIHHCSSKNELFIGNTVTRTYKDKFTQKCITKHACICFVFLLIPKVNWMKIEVFLASYTLTARSSLHFHRLQIHAFFYTSTQFLMVIQLSL